MKNKYPEAFTGFFTPVTSKPVKDTHTSFGERLQCMHSIRSFFSLFLLLVAILLGSCQSDAPEPSIPYVFVYEEINLNDINFQNLKQPNGYAYLQNAGVKGIVIIAEGNGNYKAFDRACPYHPQEDCARVSMHSSGFYLEDDCCGSTFGIEYGMPTGGPARQPLRPYNAFINGNYLIISSE